MSNPAILWNPRSSNSKTGPIPVSTTDKASCPKTCPFMNNGCYAAAGPLGMLWSTMSAAGPNATAQHGNGTIKTVDWSQRVREVARLLPTQLWRHNQAGDLPHIMGKINPVKVDALATANIGKRGFTYTHHDVEHDTDNRQVVDSANRKGFTINLSANNLSHADRLADLDAGPVVVVLPSTVEGKADIATPAGRKVVVCPATYRDDTTCASCGLCAVRDRKVIVGFPAHGSGKKKADAAIAA